MSSNAIAIRRAIVVSLGLITPVFAQTGGGYDLTWSTLDGGGGTSAGGGYEVSGTIGQPDARNRPELMTGGNYTLIGGFWVIPECPAVPADYDGDCDVDQADYQAFEACASGPEIPLAASCENKDLDPDGDVDQLDFGLFQRCLSGEDNPADPACAD